MNAHLTGQYVPGSSFLHRLDPRAKFFGFLFLVAASVIADNAAGYGIVAAFLLALLLGCRLNLRLVLGAVARLWSLYLLVFLMNALFFSAAEPIWHWWIFTLSVEGILQGLQVVGTIIPVMVCSNILTQTTRPLELTGAIQTFLKPLRLLRLPVEEIAMILSVAIQFIPTLLEETDTIKKAQIARGARFESRRLHERAAALLPLVVPIFLSAFQRADELATAMEARGYRGAKHRLKHRETPLPANGWAAMGISAALCGITVFCHYYFI